MTSPHEIADIWRETSKLAALLPVCCRQILEMMRAGDDSPAKADLPKDHRSTCQHPEHAALL